MPKKYISFAQAKALIENSSLVSLDMDQLSSTFKADEDTIKFSNEEYCGSIKAYSQDNEKVEIIESEDFPEIKLYCFFYNGQGSGTFNVGLISKFDQIELDK